MVRCIIKNCLNKRAQRNKVSFFNLPKNDEIRKSWFQEIGEVILPSNIQNGKWPYKDCICNTLQLKYIIYCNYNYN